jgi:hypothetical protein
LRQAVKMVSTDSLLMSVRWSSHPLVVAESLVCDDLIEHTLPLSQEETFRQDDCVCSWLEPKQRTIGLSPSL